MSLHIAILSLWHYLLIVAEAQYLYLLNILVSFYLFLSKSGMLPLLLNYLQGQSPPEYCLHPWLQRQVMGRSFSACFDSYQG